MKYLAFWIIDFPDGKRQVHDYKTEKGLPFFKPNGEPIENSGSTHVIEYAAYAESLKMLEEMDEALKDHIRLSQGTIPLAYEKRAYAILDKYRKFKEGIK